MDMHKWQEDVCAGLYTAMVSACMKAIIWVLWLSHEVILAEEIISLSMKTVTMNKDISVILLFVPGISQHSLNELALEVYTKGLKCIKAHRLKGTA